MFYKIGDKVTLKDCYFENYNGKEFEIIQIYKFYTYKVKADGFDPIWVTTENFVKKGE